MSPLCQGMFPMSEGNDLLNPPTSAWGCNGTDSLEGVVGGGKRKRRNHKRKSHKRKSHKRKSHKRKSHKRKSHKRKSRRSTRKGMRRKTARRAYMKKK